MNHPEHVEGLGVMNKLHFGTKYTELESLTIEGLMNQTERPLCPDLSLVRITFKRVALEDVSGEQEEFL